MTAVQTNEQPRVLTMESYERDWRPRGWQLIIIGPTSSWRQDWGEWEAIRDIVQNALDEAEKYSFGYDDHGMWILDKGKGVSVADFLLGPPKVKPDYARGKFGEGMKIAALSLLREGYSIHVKTVGRVLWIVFLEQKVNGTAETLAALWRKDGTRRGTEFQIIGYFGSSYENGFAVNIPRSQILASVPSPLTEPIQRYNQLIEAKGMAASPDGGLIYCRDIYLKPIKSPFSYNLWGFDLAPDRHGPKAESDMWTDMGRLWCGVSDVRLLQQFLAMMMVEPAPMETYETRSVSMPTWGMGRDPVSKKNYLELIEENATAWKKAWDETAGKYVVIRTDSRWDGLVKHIGYTSSAVYYGVRDALTRAITSDRELVDQMQESLRGTDVVPDTELTDRALAHLGLARSISSNFMEAPPVDAAVIPPASDRARVAGLYDMGTGRITLHLETLERAENTVDAMIHELGHHVAYMRGSHLPHEERCRAAEDLQPAHSEAMTFVAAKVFNLASNRIFDQHLREATW